jgi:hypothetical protein
LGSKTGCFRALATNAWLSGMGDFWRAYFKPMVLRMPEMIFGICSNTNLTLKLLTNKFYDIIKSIEAKIQSLIPGNKSLKL